MPNDGMPEFEQLPEVFLTPSDRVTKEYEFQNEEALTGAILRDGGIYTEIREIVRPEHLANWNYQQVWNAFETLFENGMGIDTITVGDELERKEIKLQSGGVGGRSLLSKIRENGEPRNALSYAEIVLDQFQKRQLYPFLAQCVLWTKNGRPAREIIKDINTAFSKIVIYSAQDEFTVPIGEAMRGAYEMTAKASRGEMVGINTGFIDIDRMLGGLLPGNIYLIAARTGMGKTSLLMNIGLNAAKHGKKVAIFSLEMSKEQVAQRLASQMTDIDLQTGIMQGHLTAEEWEKYVKAVEDIEKLPIMINDISSIDINQVRQTARKLKPDLVILDYIQLAQSGEKVNERRELEVSAVSRGLKYLGRELNVPVLAAAQLSRQPDHRKDNRPILSDLRESGSLEQDAYAVMFIHRAIETSNIHEIIVAKHRNGPTGSIDLMGRLQYAKFENMAFRKDEE